MIGHEEGLIAAELFQILPYFRGPGIYWLSHFRNTFALVEGGEQCHFRDGVAFLTQQFAPFLRLPIGHAMITDVNGGKEFRLAIGAYREDEFVPRTQFTASTP